MTDKKPEKTFSTGAIAVAIWQNDDKKNPGKTYRSCTFQKRVKINEEWKNTNSLQLNDVPKACVVLWKAYSYMVLKLLVQVLLQAKLLKQMLQVQLVFRKKILLWLNFFLFFYEADVRKAVFALHLAFPAVPQHDCGQMMPFYSKKL